EMVMECLQHEWNLLEDDKSALKVSLEFMVEIDKRKQEYLRTRFPSARWVFDDMKEMGKKSAKTWDGSEQTIPEVDLFVAGFPCVSISTLTVTPGSVMDPACQSGCGFRAVEQYARKYDRVWTSLTKLGYLVTALGCNTADYGLPQQRSRANVEATIAKLRGNTGCGSDREVAILAAAVEEIRQTKQIDPFKETLVIQVDQNFGRQTYPKSNLRTTSCVIPGGKYICTGEMKFRCLTDKERASLQGVGPMDWAHYKMGEVPSSTMRSFIGNAFSVPVHLGALVSLLAHWEPAEAADVHGASEEKGWPVEGGGSFQDVVLRAFGDPERFLEDSANFVKSVGLLARDADGEMLGLRLPASVDEDTFMEEDERDSWHIGEFGLVANKDFEGENPWVNNSEFGCCGRPLTEDKVLLPLSRELLLPESLDPDSDLRFAERARPSTEATSAQKGQHRWLTMLRSMLNMTNYNMKGKPVIVLNLTPYVEDVFRLREKQEEIKGGFNTSMLFYQSVWFLNKDQYGAARLTREVVDSWLQGKLEFGGQRINLEPPQLTAEEINSVPGGTAAMNKLDSVQFEVLDRQGGKMMIRQDEHKFWSSQGGVIAEEYNTLRANHLQLAGAGVAVGASGSEVVETETAPTEPPSEPPAASEEAESLSKLQETVGVELKCTSEINGVELILGKDSSLWLLAGADKLINKHAQLGGFGTGQYVPAEGEEGLEFQLVMGDKSLVQLDESSWKADGTGTSVVSFYKLLVMCESEKHITEHKVSYLNVTRKSDTNLEGGMDGFEIGYKNRMRFKCLAQDRMSGKNFFPS
ncbi:Uncharacterized protein SCF082_LOCUS12137, partial [Durusdinium trenchii]